MSLINTFTIKNYSILKFGDFFFLLGILGNRIIRFYSKAGRVAKSRMGRSAT